MIVSGTLLQTPPNILYGQFVPLKLVLEQLSISVFPISSKTHAVSAKPSWRSHGNDNKMILVRYFYKLVCTFISDRVMCLYTMSERRDDAGVECKLPYFK